MLPTGVKRLRSSRSGSSSNTPMIPAAKRSSSSMGSTATAVEPEDNLSEADLYEEIRQMSREIEPITMKQSPSASADQQNSPIIGYRATYRAVLARKGYLVRNTLGSGSYSKAGIPNYSSI